MSKGKEFRRHARIASVGLLAGLGAMSVAPNANAAPECDIPARVKDIGRHIKLSKYAISDSTPFETTVTRPKDRNSIVKVFDREMVEGDRRGESSDDKQFMIDPLTIRCAGKVVRFVGVTPDSKGSLGKQYKVANTGLYLNVVRPENTVMQIFPGSGEVDDSDQFDAPLTSLLNRTVKARLDVVQDEYTGAYATFIAQQSPHHQFGTMVSAR